MHFQSPILKKLGIQSGHGIRASLMFSYIFLIIATLLVVKPVRTSLFLSVCGAEQLPYVFMLVAAVSAVVAVFYSKLASRIHLGRLVTGSLILSIFLFTLLWVLLRLDLDDAWFVYFFYIWVAIFGVISASQFWLLANYVYNAREAKRIFGFLGAGAIAGGIFGGYLTNFVVPIFGTDNLLLICVLFLMLTLVALRWIWPRYARRNYREGMVQSRKKRQQAMSTKPIKLLFGSKQLLYLSALIGVGVLVSSLVEFQFNTIASEAIPNEDKLTAFFGFWYSSISVAALVVQLVVTSRLFSRFGITPSLYFLPAGILVGASAVLFIPGLVSATLLRVLEGGFKQSINKSGTELLALPIPSVIKNRTKIFTDMLVPNTAEGLGGALLLFFTIIIGLKVQYISLIIFSMLIIWAVLIHLVKREYVNAFRQAIEKRSVNLEELTINVNNASVRRIIERVLDSENPRQVLYVLQLLEDSPEASVQPYIEKLIDHPSPEVRAQVLRIARNIPDLDLSETAEKLVEENAEKIRLAAIDYLCHRTTDPVSVLNRFRFSDDVDLQIAATKAAVIFYQENAQARKLMQPEQMRSESLHHLESLKLKPQQKNKLLANDAELIGLLNLEELYPALHGYLDSDSVSVLRSALQAAGQTRSPQFISRLIEHMNTKLVRSYARSALAEYGDEVIDILVEKIKDTECPNLIRYGAIRVLSLIASPRAIRELFQALQTDDLELRYAIVKALNKIKDTNPDLKLDSKRIIQLAREEVDYRYQLLTILDQHQRQSEADVEENLIAARRLLEKAIEERLALNLERLFRILALQYSQDDIYAAYLGILSRNAILHANAVEFLDNILSVELKQLLIPVVEQKIESEAFSAGLSAMKDESETDYLNALLNSPDNWLNACALYYIAESGDNLWNEAVQNKIRHSVPIVSETAQFAVNRLKNS